VAAAFNNRQALETLLFLGANPNIEDHYGQKPVALATDESIRELLTLKMARAKPLGILYRIERARLQSGTGLVPVQAESTPVMVEEAPL
jgi:hypothetical protein